MGVYRVCQSSTMPNLLFPVGTETKYKFLSEQEGEKGQLECLYKACKGVPQVLCPLS
jgi:hypothetical protein